MIRPSFNGFMRFGSGRSGKVQQFVSTPTCKACDGMTIDINGAQCRKCRGAGFTTFKGTYAVARGEKVR